MNLMFFIKPAKCLNLKQISHNKIMTMLWPLNYLIKIINTTISPIKLIKIKFNMVNLTMMIKRKNIFLLKITSKIDKMCLANPDIIKFNMVNLTMMINGKNLMLLKITSKIEKMCLANPDKIICLQRWLRMSKRVCIFLIITIITPRKKNTQRE